MVSSRTVEYNIIFGSDDKSYRVDASAVTDTKKATPLEIALENNNEEIASMLCNAIGQKVPDKIKIMQLSKAMYKDNKTEAKREFKELLESLDPELVGFFLIKSLTSSLLYFKVASTSVNSHGFMTTQGSLLQNAAHDGKIDFVRLLLDHG